MAYEIQFSALGDNVRCKMIEMLRQRSYPVHELAAAFPISRPAISRHLRVLKEAGFVVEIKRGRENHYTMQEADFAAMSLWLGDLALKPKPAPRPKPAKSSVRPQLHVIAATPEILARAPVRPAKPAIVQQSLFSQMEFEL